MIGWPSLESIKAHRISLLVVRIRMLWISSIFKFFRIRGAVADGHGSAKYVRSADGAGFAVDLATKELVLFLDRNELGTYRQMN